MQETFPIEKDEAGLYRLGYTATFDGGGTVHLDMGATDPGQMEVTVRDETDARQFIRARNRALEAARWNRKSNDNPWTLERLQEAVRAAVAWAVEGPGVHAHNTLSHHGISAKGILTMHGTLMERVRFGIHAEGIVRITAYEESYFMEGSYRPEIAPWFRDVPEYDPKPVNDAIIEAVGQQPRDSWNGGRSMTFGIDLHPDTYAAFTDRDCDVCGYTRSNQMGTYHHTGTKPDGWR